MAAKLIEAYRGPWRPEKYKDTYRAELCGLIEAKRKGQASPVAAKAEEEEPADLLEAVRRSVQAAAQCAAATRRTANRSRKLPAARAPARPASAGSVL